ncbi:MAG: fructose-1,6-bisphosphatase [Candidatus Thermoplasmatota archaeon]|nr:fructose-1,6-bisphosphatase [Candidatus Thermoplasmatota archaeon]
MVNMLLKDHLKGMDPELGSILSALASGAKKVASGFIDRQGSTETTNVYGETQLEMDKWADKVFIEEFKTTGVVFSLASEEQEDLVKLNDQGRFCVTMDPLDGSSLMGVDLTVGTIIGIYRSRSPLNPGRQLSAAAYVLYGPLTILVYSIGAGTHEFAMNADGDFVLQKENLVIGDGRIYSPGGLRKDYLPHHRSWIESLEELGYKLRFCGAFVSDVHQIIHKGGVFTYPASKGRPNGKLRLLFEAAPMGFIMKNAGGRSSDGKTDILDITPEKLHQRTPVYIGGKGEIEMIEGSSGKED